MSSDRVREQRVPCEFPSLEALGRRFEVLEDRANDDQSRAPRAALVGVIATVIAAVLVLTPAGAALDGLSGHDSPQVDTARETKAALEAEMLAPENVIVEALTCKAFGRDRAAKVAWCPQALNALETRPEVQALANSGRYTVSVSGNTVTVSLPDGTEAISTFQP